MLIVDPITHDRPAPSDPEVVIREARRRQRRRWLIVTVVLLILASVAAAVGLSISTPTARVTHPVASRASSASATAPQECSESGLHTSLTEEGTAPAAQYFVITLSASTGRCRLSGYPSLELLGRTGRRLATTIVRSPTLPGSGGSVTVSRDHLASFVIAMGIANYSPSRPTCPLVSALDVTLRAGSKHLTERQTLPFNPALYDYPQSAGGRCDQLTTSVLFSGRTPTSPAATGALGAVVPQCLAAQLRVTTARAGSVAALGNVGLRIAFTNTGNSTCTLTGYPTVTGVTATRTTTVVGETARTMQGPNTGRVTAVVLRPGSPAYAEIGGTDNPVGAADRCPSPYQSFDVTPPGSSQSTAVSAWVSGLDGYFPSCVTPRVSRIALPLSFVSFFVPSSPTAKKK